jgi:predicted ATP-dependent endonuclease of OLD family
MSLKSYQIRGCFGFEDSGEILFDNPKNFYYILGINSSGKSSFLRAINSFGKDMVPRDVKNFENFNSSPDQPFLIAKYRLESEKLDIQKFSNALTQFIHKRLGFNHTQSSLMNNPIIKEIIEKIKEIYEPIIDETNKNGSLVVIKDKDGNYSFDSVNDDPNIISDGIKRLNTFLGNKLKQDSDGKNFEYNGQRYHLSLAARQVENLLSIFLPEIFIFDEKFSLIEDLPKRIDSETLESSLGQNSVLGALIAFLGKEKIRIFLNTVDPDEKKSFLDKFQSKITALCQKINLQIRRDTDTDNNIDLTLSENYGLQITVRTNGKKSFYHNLSDNTKFLFAYYLFNESQTIDNSILLFDEPNKGFHSTAQGSLLNLLKSLSKNNLVLVSTHSEYLIDPDMLSSIKLMSKDTNGRLYVKNHFYDRAKGKGDYLALTPVIEAIGLKYANRIAIADKVIVTEGITDLIYIRAFNKMFEYNIELNIAPARGDSTILNVIPLLISQGLSFKIILDTSQDDIKEKIVKDYGIDEKYIYEVPIPKINSGDIKKSGIEDIFSKTDFKTKVLDENSITIDATFSRIPNSAYVTKLDKEKMVSKRILAEVFSNKSGSYSKDDFETITVESMNNIFDFMCPSTEKCLQDVT